MRTHAERGRRKRMWAGSRLPRANAQQLCEGRETSTARPGASPSAILQRSRRRIDVARRYRRRPKHAGWHFFVLLRGGGGVRKANYVRPAARRELKITVQRCPTSAFGASQSWRSCGKQRATFLKTNEKKRHVGWMMSRCFRSSRKKKSVETAEILVTLGRE